LKFLFQEKLYINSSGQSVVLEFMDEIMVYSRWYDKDNFTRLIVNMLEDIDSNFRTELAEDLIQIILQNQINENIDDMISTINYPYIPVRRRWYDEDETVHSAVEMSRFASKYADKIDKLNIIKEFFSSVEQYKRSKKNYLEEAS